MLQPFGQQRRSLAGITTNRRLQINDENQPPDDKVQRRLQTINIEDELPDAVKDKLKTRNAWGSGKIMTQTKIFENSRHSRDSLPSLNENVILDVEDALRKRNQMLAVIAPLKSYRNLNLKQTNTKLFKQKRLSDYADSRNETLKSVNLSIAFGEHKFKNRGSSLPEILQNSPYNKKIPVQELFRKPNSTSKSNKLQGLSKTKYDRKFKQEKKKIKVIYQIPKDNSKTNFIAKAEVSQVDGQIQMWCTLPENKQADQFLMKQLTLKFLEQCSVKFETAKPLKYMYVKAIFGNSEFKQIQNITELDYPSTSELFVSIQPLIKPESIDPESKSSLQTPKQFIPMSLLKQAKNSEKERKKSIMVKNKLQNPELNIKRSKKRTQSTNEQDPDIKVIFSKEVRPPSEEDVKRFSVFNKKLRRNLLNTRSMPTFESDESKTENPQLQTSRAILPTNLHLDHSPINMNHDQKKKQLRQNIKAYANRLSMQNYKYNKQYKLKQETMRQQAVAKRNLQNQMRLNGKVDVMFKNMESTSLQEGKTQKSNKQKQRFIVKKQSEIQGWKVDQATGIEDMQELEFTKPTEMSVASDEDLVLEDEDAKSSPKQKTDLFSLSSRYQSKKLKVPKKLMNQIKRKHINLDKNMENAKNKVNEMYPNKFKYQANNPMIYLKNQNTQGFTQNKLFNSYSKFKKLCTETVYNMICQNQPIPKQIGISYESLVENIQKLEEPKNPALVYNVFKAILAKDTDYLLWPQYLNFLMILESADPFERYSALLKVLDPNCENMYTQDQITLVVDLCNLQILITHNRPITPKLQKLQNQKAKQLFLRFRISPEHCQLTTEELYDLAQWGTDGNYFKTNMF